MSKIRKIRLIRKNWILKGKWVVEIGSNPHSNGDDFSILLKDFFEIKIFKSIRQKEIERRINVRKIIGMIIYIKFKLNILIGS